MKKRVLSVVLMLVLFCTGTLSAFAATTEPDVQPLYNYTASRTVTLKISGGTATCSAELIGYQGTTTKASVKLTLQKKTLLWWDDVSAGNSYTNYSHTIDASETHSVGSGTYRVKAEFIAYSGSASESFTAYSNEVKA